MGIVNPFSRALSYVKTEDDDDSDDDGLTFPQCDEIRSMHDEILRFRGIIVFVVASSYYESLEPCTQKSSRLDNIKGPKWSHE